MCHSVPFCSLLFCTSLTRLLTLSPCLPQYLYLLFSDSSLLPLDQWVFNTEAHPLPIRGVSAFYRAHVGD